MLPTYARMNDLPTFMHQLRRDGNIERALVRLHEDFALPEPLVLAAAWLGSHGVPPDAVLAGRLDEQWQKARSHEQDREMTWMASFGGLHEFAADMTRPDTLAGWFLLVAPGSASCLEQAQWLEVIRRGCLRVRSDLN